MFLQDSNDGIIRIEALNCESLPGDAFRWRPTGRDVDGSNIRAVTPTGSSWTKDMGGTLEFDFLINTAGMYSVQFLVKTHNSDCWVWFEYDNKTTKVGHDDSGRIRFNTTILNQQIWRWQSGDGFSDSDVTKMDLYAGRHTMKIHSITNGLFIRNIAIVPIDNNGFSADVPIPYQLYSEDGDISKPSLVHPRNLSTLDGSAQRFSFTKNNDVDIDGWRFHFGSTLGGTDITVFNFWPIVDIVPGGMPTDGSIVYLRYWTRKNGIWTQHPDRLFTAYSSPPKDQTYVEWLDDSTRNDKRVALFELDHDGGMISLASQPYIDSENNIEYDDFIISSPWLESSIVDNAEIGDIEARSPILTEDWLNLKFHGHRCRWYYGDVNWPKRKFKMIAGATIDECEPITDRDYRFTLIGDSHRLKKTFHEVDTTIINTATVRNAIKWVMEFDDVINDSSFTEIVGEYQFINIPEELLTKTVRYTIDSNTIMQDVIDKICISINAYNRFSQRGVLEILIPDISNQPSVTYNDDTLENGSLISNKTIHKVQNVSIKYGDDNVYTRNADIDADAPMSASLDEILVIETYLTNLADAEELAKAVADEYANDRRIYEMKVINYSDITQVGDHIMINHTRLVGSGIVVHIQRTPLHNNSIVEVLI